MGLTTMPTGEKFMAATPNHNRNPTSGKRAPELKSSSAARARGQSRRISRSRIAIPEEAMAVAVLAHDTTSAAGHGCRLVASRMLGQLGIATVQPELYSYPERTEARHEYLIRVADELSRESATRSLPVALIAMGHLCDAALLAAAELPGIVRAVSLIGWRSQLEVERRISFDTPVLALLDGRDPAAVHRDRELLAGLPAVEIQIVPGNLDTLSDPGLLEGICLRVARWLRTALYVPRQ